MSTSATGWFDLSFSENVMEDLAFDWGKDVKDPANPTKPLQVDWWCVDGGTEVMIKKMLEQWKIKVNYRMPVTSIALDKTATADVDKMIVKHFDPETKKIVTKRYAAVINSTTLAALQKMDLTQLELSYATKTAIRSLRYDVSSCSPPVSHTDIGEKTSTKVGIKFKRAWWMEKPYNIRGGLGKTDLPLRVWWVHRRLILLLADCCGSVYPSYNVDDPKNESAVLLCSYTVSHSPDV